MNSPKIRFLYFLKYWPIPFGVLQICCKIQKCKKIIFMFKKSMRKHIFKTSNICFFYIYKKNVQNMLGYWPYTTHKNIFFIFSLSKTQTLHLITIKVILNPRIYVETCSYIFTRNTTWFYLSFRYLTIHQIKTINSFFYLFDFII